MHWGTWGAWGAGHGPWFLLWLFWIVIIALLIWGVTRWLNARNMPIPPSHPGGVPPAQPSSLEILRQRYARGEIDTVTFNQMRERMGYADEGSTL